MRRGKKKKICIKNVTDSMSTFMHHICIRFGEFKKNKEKKTKTLAILLSALYMTQCCCNLSLLFVSDFSASKVHLKQQTPNTPEKKLEQSNLKMQPTRELFFMQMLFFSLHELLRFTKKALNGWFPLVQPLVSFI